MPELPEMENYRILLSKQILDIPITGVTVSREKSINTEVETFEKQLLGTTVVYLERRGKHLIFHLNTGGRLVLHLMLGGLLFLGTEEQRPDRTVQIELDFSGVKLYFIGLRLGYLHLLTAKETEEALSDLGPDPLDRRMTLEKFTARLKGRRGILKTTLVNQQIFQVLAIVIRTKLLISPDLHRVPKYKTLCSRQKKWKSYTMPLNPYYVKLLRKAGTWKCL